MAWYQIWGLPRPWRSATNMTYCAARFFAEGGKGINYFLWHGGTNFGRDSMYLQTTQYEFGAALDEFGCRTLKYEMLSSLNKALVAHQDILAACDMPEVREILPDVGARVFSHGGREIVFLFNDRDVSTGNVEFEWREQTWSLPGRSILMLVENKETWRCSETDTPDPAKRVFAPIRTIKDAEWQEAVECMPDEKDFIHTGQPREQLAFTKNKSDYAWYKSDIIVSGNNPQKGVVTFHGINDFFQVFINGRRVAVSNGHLLEDRGPWDGEDYRQSFELELQPGRHQLAVLVCSLGLVKGDWQAGRRNMVEERKGFWGHASWRPNPGMAADCVRIGDWHIHPGLSGEITRIAASEGRSTQWSPFRLESSGVPLRWYRLKFPTPPGDEPLAFDFGGLGKGLAWVNGECLGRYWTVNSVAPTIIHTEHNQVMNFSPPGGPSQRYYHLPREWLRERENTLLLFEETGGDPGGVELVKWLPESSQE